MPQVQLHCFMFCGPSVAKLAHQRLIFLKQTEQKFWTSQFMLTLQMSIQSFTKNLSGTSYGLFWQELGWYQRVKCFLVVNMNFGEQTTNPIESFGEIKNSLKYKTSMTKWSDPRSLCLKTPRKKKRQMQCTSVLQPRYQVLVSHMAVSMRFVWQSMRISWWFHSCSWSMMSWF